MSKQDEILKITADLWNRYLEIPTEEKHHDDNNDVRFHIHGIQNILYTQKYKKEKAALEIKGSDLIGVLNNTNRRI